MFQSGQLNTVIFKKPNDEKVYVFVPGDGDSKFIVAPFLKSNETHEFKGFLKQISASDLTYYLEKIELSLALEQNQTKKNQYIQLVEEAKLAIAHRKFDKVVVAGRKWVDYTRPLVEVFMELLALNHSAFVYIFQMGQQVMMGASPELLLEKVGNRLNTVALGGTETHGTYTSKEQLEHQQIRDYIEGILIQNAYQFEAAATESIQAAKVSHLKTPYQIRTIGLMQDLSLVKALHPTSAICGLPLESSLKFIKENEGFDRNFYSGYIGFIESSGDFKFYVNLRCGLVFKGGCQLYAGAGINAMSVAEDEWEEINKKMETIAQCLK